MQSQSHVTSGHLAASSSITYVFAAASCSHSTDLPPSKSKGLGTIIKECLHRATYLGGCEMLSLSIYSIHIGFVLHYMANGLAAQPLFLSDFACGLIKCERRHNVKILTSYCENLS